MTVWVAAQVMDEPGESAATGRGGVHVPIVAEASKSDTTEIVTLPVFVTPIV